MRDDTKNESFVPSELDRLTAMSVAREAPLMSKDTGESFPDILRTGSMLDRAAEMLESIPPQLGAYRILEPIGEGGMGIVFLAEQAPPLARRVAIKVARHAGHDGRALARFESERQTLAVMNHPHIARVFDAGSAPDGRPYFVMEHVSGDSITAFCDEQKLGIEARLELVVRVCAGVQHAHVNAVIHRDLKPSNILVTTASGTPTPKIIDFGVAKALGAGAGTERGLTQFGQIVGTPEYMSPEQAALDGRPVDTRTDVYSLGVLLYELLVGSRPFERAAGRDESLVDLCRRIREDEPERPSLRASRASNADAAMTRGLLPRTLSHRLRGDLDAIVLKALGKEPGRRYASPSDLAADIERHLNHRVVGARPPNVLVQARKSLRRHRTAWTLMGTLVGVAALGTTQAIRSHQESVRSEAVKDFVVGLLNPPEPVVTGAHVVSLISPPERDVLLKLIRERFADQPELLGQLLVAAGRVALNMNVEFDTLQEARDFVIEQQGADSPAAIEADESLARAYADFNRHAQAEPLQSSAVERRLRLDGPDHPQTWRSISRMAYVYKSAHKHDQAAPLFEKAIAGLERWLGPDDPDVLSSTVSLSGSYLALGRYRETRELLDGAIGKIRRVHGERDYQTYVAFYNLACAHSHLGHAEAAFDNLRESIERGFAYPDGPARDPHLLALHKDSRFEVLDRVGRLNSRGLWHTRFIHASERIAEGRYGEAERMLPELIAVADRMDTKGFGDRASGARWLQAKCWIRQRRYDDAEALLLPLLLKSPAPGGRDVFELLAQCDIGRGRVESALNRIAKGVAAADPELENVEVTYFEAEADALRGQDEVALGKLARISELGFDDFDRLENDLAFVKLRSRNEFKAVAIAARKRAL